MSDERMPRGRLRASIAGLEVRDDPGGPLVGPGLEVAGHRLDADDVDELRDELDRYLDERGRR